MRIVRFAAGDKIMYGAQQEDSTRLAALVGDPLFSKSQATGEIFEIDEVRVLSPVIPRSKVVGFGRNYAEHVKEMGNEIPEMPVMFLKPNTAVSGPVDPIIIPRWSSEVHHEAELAVVVKTVVKDIKAADWRHYVAGFTVANDVSARDAQRSDSQWTRAKGFDTSCPLGPCIRVDEDLDINNLRIRSWVDGQLRQDGNTSQMLHKVPQLLEYASTVFTLLPGDVILTGTPAGVGPIEAGQLCSVEIEGIGRLDNPVLAAD